MEPSLATSWRIVDPRTWEFELRHGVRFHDGTPLTADDVVFYGKNDGARAHGGAPHGLHGECGRFSGSGNGEPRRRQRRLRVPLVIW